MSDLVTQHCPLETDNVPDGWKLVSISDFVSDIQTGFASGQHNRNGIGVPHLRPMNISPTGDIDLSDLRYVPPDKNPLRLKLGDVLFNNTNSPAWVGKTAFVATATELAFSNHMTRLRVPEGVDPRYLAKQLQYLCATNYFQYQCKKHVNQASINRSFLGESTPFLLPPSNEQRRIVAKIEALQERSRKAREALSEVKPLLEKFRQSLLAAAFRGDLTADWRKQNPDVEPASGLLQRIRKERRQKWEQAELAKHEAKGKKPPKGWQDKYKEPEPVNDSELSELPDGWCWTSLGELTFIDSGEAFKKKDYSGSGIRLFQIANVSFGHTQWKQENFLPEIFRESFPHLLLDDTDIMIALNRPILDGQLKVTRLSATDLPAILYQRVGRIRTAIGSIADYLFTFMRGPSMLKQVESKLQGSDQPYINTSDIPRIIIPLAPFDEQSEIARICTAAMNFVGDQLTDLVKSDSHLSQLDQAILAKAFRGELVPQDPDDEPAAVLLERIRQQREAATAARKKRKKARGKGAER